MSGKHLRSLDGLRGVAILLVVVYHLFPHRGAGFLGYLTSGAWFGVDLFFVLSGFLITGILFDTQGAPFFYRNFYIRRALRLSPVYIVFIALAAIFQRQPTGHPWYISAAFILYASNLVLFFIPNFQWGLPVVTGHTWSLAVEEQFYLMWPWIVTRLRTRRRILYACLWGTLMALTLRLVCNHFVTRNLWFLYYELPTRADSLLMGAAAAMLYRIPGFLEQHLNKIRIAGGLAALTFLALAFRARTFFFVAPPIDTWGFTLLAIASAALLLSAIQPNSHIGRALAHPFLRFYGRYSYGLYLFHQAPNNYDTIYLWPIFEAHIHPLWLAGAIHLLLILGLSTAVAVLSFRFIEQPFLRLKKRFPDQPVALSKHETAVAT